MKVLSNKKLAWLLFFSMVIGGFMGFGDIGHAQQKLTDIQGHWAETQINKWVSKGLIKGYEDSTFKPDDNITRAEFITLINGVIKPVEQKNKSFRDVKDSDWYAVQVKKAIACGYISGYDDDTIKPNNPITRQEVAIVISKLLKLKSQKDSDILNKFSDKNEIASWSKKAVSAVVEKGFMGGYPDGTSRPKKPITRAESIAVLDKVMGEIYCEDGTYGPRKGMDTINGNLTIIGKNVVVRNTKVKGSLYLAEGIDDGEVTLDNVTVLGETIIKGGGENSIIFNNTTLGDVIVFKANGRIRVVAKGKTNIGKTLMESGAKLQEDGLKGDGFEEVEVITVASGEKLVLDGDFEDITIETKIKVDVTDKTVIKKLDIEESAEGSEIDLDKDTKVENMRVEGKAKIEGKGIVEKAEVKEEAQGTSFATAPKKTTVEKGVKVKIAGKTITGTGKTVDSTPSKKTKKKSSGGGSTTTPSYTYTVKDTFVVQSFTKTFTLKKNGALVRGYTLYMGNDKIAEDLDEDGIVIAPNAILDKNGTLKITLKGSSTKETPEKSN